MPRFSQADLARLGYDGSGRRFHVERAGTAPGTEKSLHEAILAFCRRAQLPVVHSRMDRPTTSGVGTPDFVIALPSGRTLWVEAKAGKGKLRPEQAAWMAALNRHDHHAGVVRDMQEFLTLVDHAKSIRPPQEPGR